MTLRRAGIGFLRSRSFQAAGIVAGLAGVCAVTLAIPTANSSSIPAAQIDEQVDGAHDDLADANKKVTKVTRELKATEAKLKPAQERLAAASQTADAANAAAAVAQKALAEAEAAVEVVRADIVKVRGEIADLRARIGMLARVAYTSGGQFKEVQILLESKDPSEFADRLTALGRVNAGNTQTLELLASLKQQLDSKLAEAKRLEDLAEVHRNEVRVKAAEAQAALDRAAVAKQEVDALIAEQKRIVKKADSERDKVKAQYEALLAEQRRIQEELRKAAERERRKAERERQKNGGTAPPLEPSVIATGPLDWPLPGRRAGGRTGPRIHPLYGYRSCHTGDDIGAPSGTPIRSAADGVVSSTTSGGPYGNNTIINHGGGLSTMYAHQSRFGVKRGDTVKKGQVIGYVGSTGYSTGPHLHFEVHINGVPWEPMGWFGESKHRVSCA